MTLFVINGCTEYTVQSTLCNVQCAILIHAILDFALISASSPFSSPIICIFILNSRLILFHHQSAAFVLDWVTFQLFKARSRNCNSFRSPSGKETQMLEFVMSHLKIRSENIGWSDFFFWIIRFKTNHKACTRREGGREGYNLFVDCISVYR